MVRSTIVVLVALALGSRAEAVDYVQGIDVSHWQGNINWTSVKNAGIKFAFAKATEGVDFVDVNFHQYMNDAMAAGVPIGPYHFARVNSGETQSAGCRQRSGRFRRHDPSVLPKFGDGDAAGAGP